MSEKPGLYIHIPFCIKKCNYCDFPSYAGKEGMFEKYVEALLNECEKYKGTEIDTVFMGGGTPTCLSAELLERLLKGLSKSFRITAGAEFSAEANPGTVNFDKLAVLKSGGVNRLSIGVQSLNDRELRVLGRIHDSKTALETVALAQKYFDNINIDIMTALPGQTSQSLMKTIKAAVATGVQHLSCYSLIVEEGTHFYDLYSKGELELCSEEEDRTMYETLCSYLYRNSFERYEISNFAKRGRRCRHNLKYWNTEDYIGIGAAAHSCINGVRYHNAADVEKYIESPTVPEETLQLSTADQIGEYVMMALRTADGVGLEKFERRFGKSFDEVFPHKTANFEKNGFMKRTEKGIALTEKGFYVSNSIMCEFV